MKLKTFLAKASSKVYKKIFKKLIMIVCPVVYMNGNKPMIYYMRL